MIELRARATAAPLRLAGDVAARVTAFVLGVRGVGGLVVSGLGLVNAPEVFRRNDVRYYSPLCLALAAGAVCAYRQKHVEKSEESAPPGQSGALSLS